MESLYASHNSDIKSEYVIEKKPIKIIVSDNIIGIGLWDAAKQNLALVKVVQLFIILHNSKIFITFCSLKARS